MGHEVSALFDVPNFLTMVRKSPTLKRGGGQGSAFTNFALARSIQ